jgi:pentatricopeptide repeat protein
VTIRLLLASNQNQKLRLAIPLLSIRKHTLSTLLTLLISVPERDSSDGLGAKATQFLRQVVASNEGKITIDSVLYNNVLRAFVTEGKLTKADEFLAMMPSKDVRSYSTLISGWGKAGHGDRAMDLFDEMLDAGIPADSKVVT